jgi:hypothetical protein
MCLTLGFGHSLLALAELFLLLTLEPRSALVGLGPFVLELTEGRLIGRYLDLKCKVFDLPGQHDIIVSALQFFFRLGWE